MAVVEMIADQLRRAHEGQAWHGPALRVILEGVTAEQAAARPLPDAHSMAELVGHIAAWQRAALRGIETGSVEVPERENFPSCGASEDAWRETLAELEGSRSALHQAILRLSDADLEREIVSGEDRYSLCFLLHGAIQHAVYHAGQLQLLKRLR